MSRVLVPIVFLVWLCGSPTYAAIEDYDIPKSPWIERESQIASAAVVESEADYLVLPAQGGNLRFGPVESTLIAAVIATQLELRANVTVIDPTVARLALGKNRMNVPAADAAKLAQRGNVGRLVVPFAEYSESGTFLLRLTVYDPATEKALSSKTWDAIEFDEETLPHLAIAGHLPAMINFVLGRTTGEPDRPEFEFGDDFRFVESWQELSAAARKSPLHSAAYLQLLAMLHTGGRWNESRQSLLIRSIAELSRVDASSEGYRYLLARAYAYLDRRPAALEALGEPVSAYEIALREALDGNATELRARLSDLETGPMDFFVLRDALRLEEYYLGPFGEDQYGALVAKNPAWQVLLRLALHHSHAWLTIPVDDIQRAVDHWLPDSQSWLSKALTAVRSRTGDYTEIDAARDYFGRLDEYADAALGSPELLSASSFGIRQSDFVDLAKETLIATLIGRIVEDRDRRGLPDSALERSKQAMNAFPGHPEVALLLGETIRIAGSDAEGDEAYAVRERSHEHLRHGLIWTGAMNHRAVDVARRAGVVFIDPSTDEQRRRSITSIVQPTPYRSLERPRSPSWLRGHSGNDIVRKEGLDYCLGVFWAAFGCIEIFVAEAIGRGKDEREVRAIVARGDGRFNGEPRRASLEMRLAEAFGTDRSAWEKSLYTQVDAGTTSWNVYYSLARHLRRQNRQDEALQVLLRYPLFRDYERRDALSVTNYAGITGSWFYWAGQTEQAVPLLEIAARTRTGAAIEYQALVRLALIEGDLDGAFEYTYGRARRYESPYAVRDLIQLLHVRGDSEPAWDLFNFYWDTEGWAQIWSGALVGHRKAGDDLDDVRGWLATIAQHEPPGEVTAGHLARIHRPSRYLMLFAMLDRGATPGLLSAVREVEPTVYGPAYRGGNVTYHNGELYSGDPLLTTQTEESPRFETAKLPALYEWRAEAMTAFLGGDYEGAREIFDELSFYYSVDEYLPYVAIAAAETGHSAKVRQALAARETKLAERREREASDRTVTGLRFNEDLAYAVLAAYDGEHTLAIDKLYEALNDRPFLNDRTIYPYYQLVDIAERLYRRTGYEGYKEFALDRARRHTIIQPMYAWAYFVVATHSADDAERKRAARKGFELDRDSYRGSLLQPSLRVRVEN